MWDILKIDNELYDVFENNTQFQVHSIFDKVINFSHSTSPFLWSIMPYQIGDYARTIMVSKTVFLQLKRVLTIGELITIKQNKIQLQHNVLYDDNSKKYIVPKLTAKHINNDCVTALQKEARQLIQRNGFGDYIYVKNKDVLALLNGDMSKLTYFIGRGMGLTPTGDDMLLGIIFVLTLSSSKPLLWQKLSIQLRQLLKQQLTTDVSRHYLLLALDGIFSPPLQKLACFLTTNDSVITATQVLQDIIAYGHTSGCDTLTSILTTLDYLIVE